MIYNRTQEDVNNAISLRETKVKTFAELTEDEIETLERGTITITTLNRIEDKQAELQDLLNEMGYWDTKCRNFNWSYEDVFDKSEFQRIVNNLNALKKAFFVFSGTPNTPQARYYFEDINSTEKILVDIEEMISVVKGKYRECATFECGEANEN